MIKLIKEFLLSGIKAHEAHTEASNSTSKVNKKTVEYYDTIIYNDNLRTQMLLSPSFDIPPTNLCYYDKRNSDCSVNDEDIEDHKKGLLKKE